MVWVGAHMSLHMCRGQTTSLSSQFFLTAFMWVPGIKLRSSGLLSMCLCLLRPLASLWLTFQKLNF